MSEIPARIRRIREAEQLSRPQFAERIGITSKRIQNIEQGLSRVQDDLIDAVIAQWPEYAYWLTTGQTLPEAGQISPDLNRIREDSKREGKAG